MRHLRLYLNGVTELARQVGENNDNLYVNLASLLTAMGSELAALLRSGIASGVIDAAGGLLVAYEGAKLYYSPSKAVIEKTAMDYEALFTAFRKTSHGESKAVIDRQYQDLLLADKQLQKVQLARHFQIANVLCLLSNISFGLWNITHPTVYCQVHVESGDCHHIASNPSGNWMHHVELCIKDQETGSCSYRDTPAWTEVAEIIFSMLNILFVFLHVLVCAVFLADIDAHKKHLLEDVRNRFDREDKDVLSLDLAGSYCDILAYGEEALNRVRSYVDTVIANGELVADRAKKSSQMESVDKEISDKFEAAIQNKLVDFNESLMKVILNNSTNLAVKVENAMRQLENSLEAIYKGSEQFKKNKIISLINEKINCFKVEIINIISPNSTLSRRMLKFNPFFYNPNRIFIEWQSKLLALIDTFQSKILEAFDNYLDNFFLGLKEQQKIFRSDERNQAVIKSVIKRDITLDSLPPIETNPFSFACKNNKIHNTEYGIGAGLSPEFK